jgi:hypothetical protein
MGFAESVSDQRLAALYAYWSGKRGPRALPSRADIDPADLLPLLPHILLIDVVEGGRDFRYRLVGTEIERHLGRPITGRLIGEVLRGEYSAYIRSLLQRVVAEAAPVYSENNFDGGRSGFAMIAEFKRARWLMLPLARDGVSVDIILCGQVFEPIRVLDAPEILLTDKP